MFAGCWGTRSFPQKASDERWCYIVLKYHPVVTACDWHTTDLNEGSVQNQLHVRHVTSLPVGDPPDLGRPRMSYLLTSPATLLAGTTAYLTMMQMQMISYTSFRTKLLEFDPVSSAPLFRSHRQVICTSRYRRTHPPSTPPSLLFVRCCLHLHSLVFPHRWATRGRLTCSPSSPPP